ncbi:UNVERIFIED_CONTAM: hypothetical protein H355_014773 [Colinus virginianus]|nr:hypothetical protein H355_014773 [Colinus virginianus]
MKQVSLKRREKHFCGGTIVSAQWVVTAAHCVSDRYGCDLSGAGCRNLLKYLNVTAGDHDLRVRENGEQTLPVKYIIKHPNFDPRRPMNYDVALLKLDGTFIFSSSVLPACLPDPGEKFEAGYICTTCGWGRLRESKLLELFLDIPILPCYSHFCLFASDGVLPQVLYEVNLPILNSKECSRALSTLKKPIQGDTILCAGFPDGGKDACQWIYYYSTKDDSVDSLRLGKFCGGHLPLPILIGSNNIRLKFVSDNRDYGTGFSMTYKALAPDILPVSILYDLFNKCFNFLFFSGYPDSGCQSLAVLFEEGVLQSMHYPEHYSNLADCQWIICAPEDHVIKLTYQFFEVEESEDCSYDAVTVYEDVGKEEEIGMAFNFDGSVKGSATNGDIQNGFALGDPHIICCSGEKSLYYLDNSVSASAEVFENTEMTEEEIQVTTVCKIWCQEDCCVVLKKRSVKQYIIHPSFNKTTMDSDIALLQLAEPLEFNHYVSPVCLPAKEEVVQPSSVCIVTGWGAQEEDLPIFTM